MLGPAALCPTHPLLASVQVLKPIATPAMTCPMLQHMYDALTRGLPPLVLHTVANAKVLDGSGINIGYLGERPTLRMHS